jgi:ribosomal protein S8
MKQAGLLSKVQPGDFSGPENEDYIAPVAPSNAATRRLWIGLKYVDNHPVITKCQLLSRANWRLYLNVRDIENMVKGRRVQTVKGLNMAECMFIGTSSGVFEARDCIRRNIGGEALCRVW